MTTYFYISIEQVRWN